MSDINNLKEKLAEIKDLSHALSLLSWDQQINMPQEGSPHRGRSLSLISGILHEKFNSPSFENTITALKESLNDNPEDFTGDEVCIINEVYHDFSIAKKLPLEHVKEKSILETEGYNAWRQAKESSDFSVFAPTLEKLVALARKEAEYLGYEKSPYDALLNLYEPGMKSSELSPVFNELREFLVPYIHKIQKVGVKNERTLLNNSFPIEKQKIFNAEIISQMGFDLNRGRIDETTHPFCTECSPLDVRIATRYFENKPMDSFSSTVHEAGHGLYEQGLPPDSYGTPLCEACSLSIHESQSRLWENMVAKSMPFWEYFYPRYMVLFAEQLEGVPLTDFYRAVNTVEPSFIRTESDEVTYNIHIIIRFEIEKELIEGSIEVADLPKIWNERYESYLGITPQNDAEGVLQDVHWSGMAFGYFPTYALGNLYAAQFFDAASREMPNLKEQIAEGNLTSLKNWLNQNIHCHGRRYRSHELVERVTGKTLTSAYFTAYIREKYNKIYKLED